MGSHRKPVETFPGPTRPLPPRRFEHVWLRCAEDKKKLKMLADSPRVRPPAARPARPPRARSRSGFARPFTTFYRVHGETRRQSSTCKSDLKRPCDRAPPGPTRQTRAK
jgi:hypothetical protein